MFRPNRILNTNIYSFILMRNRHEEIAEIPVAYVESISFSMGQYITEPTKVSFKIPSVLQREGKQVEQQLFHMIKEKMIIAMTINDKKYMLEIGDMDETETKDYTIKTFTAEEIHVRLEKIDCVLNTGSIATRQLYRPKDDKLDIAAGMLNLFEEQCLGWKVDTITEKARKELIMCSTTKTVFLQKVDKVITDEIFLEGVPIDIGNKPLDIKINMFCQVYDSENKLYIDSTIPFQIDSLPYAINYIQANYVSTSKNFYGIEFTIHHSNGYTTKKEFPFINCKNLRMVADISVEYKLGDLKEQWTTKYRTFDSSGSNWKAMLDDIAQSFDCIFVIDSYNQTISACHNSEFGEETGVSLFYDNAIKETTRNYSIDDLVTRMWVENPNTSIASVNLLGTDYIECYDYFKDNDIMSIELSEALGKYDLLLEQKNIEFNQLVLKRYEADQNVTLLTSQSKALENRISGEKAILSAYIKNASQDDTFKDKQYKQQLQIEELEAQKKEVDAKLAEAKTTSETLSSSITQIGIDIKKENAIYNGEKLFNETLLLELADYLIEQALSDETHLTAHSLYNYATEQIKKYQKPNVDFTIDSSMEFLKRAGVPITNYLFLGAKMVVEDRAGIIDSEDGMVLLYQFTIDPNSGDVSDFKFTNSAKAPDTPLKSISRTTQTTKATKALTDFYKATWQDMKTKSLDISEIINEGLDLAAQKVRSRSEENVIDMSEAGIFLIDAKNNNEQLALINDLVTMTTDGWRTSKVAISPEGIIAETLIGKAILSEELYISNGNSTFTILENGLTVRNNIDVDKVFLGLDSEGANPLFRLGNEADKCYFEWDNDKLNIKASKISIGSDSVATNSKLEQTASEIRLEVSNTEQQLSSKIQQTADSIRWEVSDSINKVNSSITQTANSIRAEVSNSVNGLNSKIDQTANAIRTEVNNSVSGINSKITQEANRISLAVNDIAGLRNEIQINRNNIQSKVDANGVQSVVSQNPTCVQYGFNGISDNVTIDAQGILIKHGNNYSRLDANGFTRWDGATQRSYHYLQHMGQVDIASGDTVTISLPQEFRGKDFNVIVGIKRVRMAYDVYAKKYLLMGFYAEVSNIDKWNGRFSVYGSVRGVNSTNIKPNALIAGADYATEELRPVVAYWVYA